MKFLIPVLTIVYAGIAAVFGLGSVCLLGLAALELWVAVGPSQGTAFGTRATNAIESINAQLRKIIKSRGHFPSDDAATKLIWLALRNITQDWGRAANNWKSAMNQFAILYEDRFTKSSP